MNPELHNFSHGSSNATGHFISIAAASAVLLLCTLLQCIFRD